MILRALEWTLGDADTPFGLYATLQPRLEPDQFRFVSPDGKLGEEAVGSRAGARAAAQADFESRWLACCDEKYVAALKAMAAELNTTPLQVLTQAVRQYQVEHEKRMGRFVESPPVGCPPPE